MQYRGKGRPSPDLSEGEAYVAQCLEYDISAFAPDKETLLKRFISVFGMERNRSLDRGGRPSLGSTPPPRNFMIDGSSHRR